MGDKEFAGRSLIRRQTNSKFATGKQGNSKKHYCMAGRSGAVLTPGLRYKIPVFSDPDPGKS